MSAHAWGAASVTAADEAGYSTNNGLWLFNETTGTTGHDTNANATQYNCILAGATLNQSSVDGSSATAIAFSGSASGCTMAYAGNAASSGTNAPLAITCGSIAGLCAAVGMTIPLHFEMDFRCPSSGTCAGVLMGDGDTSAHIGWSIYTASDGSTGCAGGTACLEIEMDWHGSSNRATGGIKTTFSVNVLSANSVHHLKFDYDGNGCINGHVSGYIDGQQGVPYNIADDCNDSSVAISKQPGIGIASAFFGAFTGTIQNVATYTTQYPAGQTTHLCCSSNGSLDAMAIYHGNLVVNNQNPVTNPPANPKLLFEKDCSDSDDWVTMQLLMDGQYRSKSNLLAFAANSPNAHCASGIKAFLSYWNKNSIIVAAYQGSSGNSADDGFANVESDFRPQDTADVGISSPPTMNNAGTGYQAGDILTWPLSTGAYDTVTKCVDGSNRDAQIKVDTVSSGAISTFHLYFPGCYTTAPPLTSIAVTGGHGSGATFTGTTCHDRCLYRDAQYVFHDLAVANPGVYVANGGQSPLDLELATNFASDMNANVSAWIFMRCYYPNTSTWAGSSAEFNCNSNAADWNTIETDLTMPKLHWGVENTNDISGSFPIPTQGWIYGGPANTLSNLTIPLQDGFYHSSAARTAGNQQCSAAQSSACYRTFWDMWVYWLQNQGSNPQGTGKQTWMMPEANSGSDSVNTSTGVNTFSNTTGSDFWFRRTQEALINTDLANVIAETPNSFNVEGPQIPLKGAANDNDASKRFARTLYAEWDAANDNLEQRMLKLAAWR